MNFPASMRRHRLIPRTLIAFCISALLAACGGGGNNEADAESSAPLPVTLLVSAPRTQLEEGDTSQAKAIVIYSDGVEQDITQSATWRSSNPASFSVDASGLIQFVSAGDAAISAVYEGVSGAVTIVGLSPVKVNASLPASYDGQEITLLSAQSGTIMTAGGTPATDHDVPIVNAEQAVFAADASGNPLLMSVGLGQPSSDEARELSSDSTASALVVLHPLLAEHALGLTGADQQMFMEQIAQAEQTRALAAHIASHLSAATSWFDDPQTDVFLDDARDAIVDSLLADQPAKANRKTSAGAKAFALESSKNPEELRTLPEWLQDQTANTLNNHLSEDGGLQLKLESFRIRRFNAGTSFDDALDNKSDPFKLSLHNDRSRWVDPYYRGAGQSDFAVFPSLIDTPFLAFADFELVATDFPSFRGDQLADQPDGITVEAYGLGFRSPDQLKDPEIVKRMAWPAARTIWTNFAAPTIQLLIGMRSLAKTVRVETPKRKLTEAERERNRQLDCENLPVSMLNRAVGDFAGGIDDGSIEIVSLSGAVEAFGASATDVVFGSTQEILENCTARAIRKLGLTLTFQLMKSGLKKLAALDSTVQVIRSGSLIAKTAFDVARSDAYTQFEILNLPHYSIYADGKMVANQYVSQATDVRQDRITYLPEAYDLSLEIFCGPTRAWERHCALVEVHWGDGTISTHSADEPIVHAYSEEFRAEKGLERFGVYIQMLDIAGQRSDASFPVILGPEPIRMTPRHTAYVRLYEFGAKQFPPLHTDEFSEVHLRSHSESLQVIHNEDGSFTVYSGASNVESSAGVSDNGPNYRDIRFGARDGKGKLVELVYEVVVYPSCGVSEQPDGSSFVQCIEKETIDERVIRQYHSFYDRYQTNDVCFREQTTLTTESEFQLVIQAHVGVPELIAKVVRYEGAGLQRKDSGEGASCKNPRVFRDKGTVRRAVSDRTVTSLTESNLHGVYSGSECCVSQQNPASTYRQLTIVYSQDYKIVDESRSGTSCTYREYPGKSGIEKVTWQNENQKIREPVPSSSVDIDSYCRIDDIRALSNITQGPSEFAPTH